MSVESPPGHHRRCRRGPQARRGRRHLRRLHVLALRAAGPTPRRGRRSVRTQIAATQDHTERHTASNGRADRSDCDAQLSAAGLDAGPETIGWHLTQNHGITVSRATISRHLTKAGLVDPEPKKRPKSSYIRFEAAMPNETWQSDFTHYRLTDGTDVEILHLARRLHPHGDPRHRPPPGHHPIVLAEFRQAIKTHGIPASTLTDNGMVFTVRLAGIGAKAAATAFETNSDDSTSSRRTADPTTRPLRAKSKDSNRRSRNGSAPNQRNPPRSRSSRHCWTSSSTTTTTGGPTVHCRIVRHQQRSIDSMPKALPGNYPRRRHPRPDPSRPHRQNRRRDAARQRQTPPHRHRPNPRPNPRHPAHPRPRTSASSTPSPANYCENSPSIQTRDYQPRK